MMKVVVCALAALGAMSGLAHAQSTRTASFAVNASVAANCTIVATPLAFGSYDPVVTNLATPLDGSSTVTITCTKGATSTVGLDLGAHASGGVRRLSNGGEFLTYELYKEAARTNVWGGSGSGLVNPGAAPSKTARTLTVYGRVAGGQDAATGSYTDTIVATITF
jgi:spore coat protein U-like protein